MVGTGSVSLSPAISEPIMIMRTMTMTMIMMMLTIMIMVVIMMTMANVGFWTITSRPGKLVRSIAETGEQVGLNYTLLWVKV